MGRDPQETRNSKRSAVKPAPAAPDFWSWHPTEAQKKQFETFLKEADPLEAYLEQITKLGITLTITRTKTNDSTCVVARNRFDSYGEGQAVSTFNACPVRALWGMVFVLTVMHPQWPAQAITTLQRALDW